MKTLTNVCGSVNNKIPFSVIGDTVYIRSNFQKTNSTVYNEDCELYTYDEIQYSKDEYITLLSKESSDLKQQLLDTQLALCEIYESFSR